MLLDRAASRRMPRASTAPCSTGRCWRGSTRGRSGTPNDLTQRSRLHAIAPAPVFTATHARIRGRRPACRTRLPARCSRPRRAPRPAPLPFSTPPASTRARGPLSAVDDGLGRTAECVRDDRGARSHRLDRDDAEVLHGCEHERPCATIQRLQQRARGPLDEVTAPGCPRACSRRRAASGPAPARTTGESDAIPASITASSRL